jgi:N6-adenosine-specific RNA methylase IME4
MKTYDVILADCPWNFKTYGQSNATTPQTHYNTMTIQELIDLPIKNVAAENCALFFWVVDWMSPSVCESVVNAWGFTYRTKAWTWIKAKRSGFGFHIGRGYYTQSNPEDCWLCVKGSMPVQNRSILSLIYSEVRKHSQKPEDQYRKIDALYPNMRYLELFARHQHKGWDVFGNEVKDSITL